MGPLLDDDQRAFHEQVARWADERLAPRAEALDRNGEFARDLFQELAELGYLGLMYPEEYGGAGVPIPNTYFTILCDELARGSMGFAATVCMHGSTAPGAGAPLHVPGRSLADQGRSITVKAALAELVAGENCNDVCQQALSIFGGWGSMSEFPVPVA